jgi:anaerobic selenocysteine-containing dehydrogenase
VSAIVAGLAKATLGVNWDHFIANYDDIREKIANVIPGFENFNERVRTPGGFALPHAVRDRREFATPSKKAQFTCHEIPKATLAAGQFVLMTIRTHDQFNTTIYGMNDRYRGIKQGRRIVMMNVVQLDQPVT